MKKSENWDAKPKSAKTGKFPDSASMKIQILNTNQSKSEDSTAENSNSKPNSVEIGQFKNLKNLKFGLLNSYLVKSENSKT